MNLLLTTLADVSLSPDPKKIPGSALFQDIIDGAGGYALLAGLLGLIVGAAAWGLSSRMGHAGGVSAGRTAVLAGLGTAFLVGAGPTLINWAFHAAQNI